MSNYIHVDRSNPLPPNYIPNDLVEAPIPFVLNSDDTENKRLIRKIMYQPLLDLFNESFKAGLSLIGISGFRSYKRQKEIYEASIRKRGLEYTQKYIAAPGTSEHQTGLAIDVSSPECGFELIEEFAHTKEGIWLKSNAHHFGFEFSYPEDSFPRTGYNYEPWHIRFSCERENESC